MNCSGVYDRRNGPRTAAATASRQMQHAPDRDGQSAGHALRVILLQTGDCFANLDRINAVNRPAIIAETRQVSLQRAHVSRRRDQLAAAFKIVERTPRVAWREISVVNSRAALMEQSPVVPRCQRISRVEKRPIENYIFEIGPGDG